MYHSLTMSQLLQWRLENKSTNGMVRHVVDSKTWAHIDETWSNFASEPWNLRMQFPRMG